MNNPLMARFAGELALLNQTSTERFTSCLEQAVAHPHFAEALATRADTTDDFWAAPEGTWQAALRPYVVKDGVLQIPVKGVLLHDFPFALYDWATGYDYIWRAFQRGCGDYATGAIKGIALICDSPGGMVAGCFDAVDKMVALKEQLGVPVRAFAHESAYSAAYAIATVADHIAVSRTGGVGSIGVITTHVDVSAAMEKQGVKVTFIASDPSKYEGTSYQPLSDDAKARIQARIDELYSIFVAAVARSRGLDEATIRDELKAYCYTATQALSNGLADSVGSLEDATSAFAESLDAPSDTDGDDQMSNQDTAAESQAAITAAQTEGHTAGRAEGLTAGASAERDRIAAILDSEEAKDRPAAARMLAFDTDKDPESARASLAKLPKEAAATPVTPAPAEGAAPATPFEDAMDRSGNPNVGVNSPGAAKDDEEDVFALAAATGVRLQPPAGAAKH